MKNLQEIVQELERRRKAYSDELQGPVNPFDSYTNDCPALRALIRDWGHLEELTYLQKWIEE